MWYLLCLALFWPPPTVSLSICHLNYLKGKYVRLRPNSDLSWAVRKKAQSFFPQLLGLKNGFIFTLAAEIYCWYCICSMKLLKFLQRPGKNGGCLEIVCILLWTKFSSSSLIQTSFRKQNCFACILWTDLTKLWCSYFSILLIHLSKYVYFGVINDPADILWHFVTLSLEIHY